MNGEPPSCGNCDDGYVFEPPLQDGALGVCVSCEACRRLANAFWRNYEPENDSVERYHLKGKQ